MPITWRFEADGAYIVFSVRDPFTMDEWREAMTEIVQAPAHRTHMAMLVDRRDTEPLTTKAVEEMVQFYAQHQRAFAGLRSAIVVNDDAVFGMGRMTQLRSRLEMPNTTVRLFRRYDEAVAWLTTT